MDPVTAVGFAANILGFIDFVSHLLAIGSQIRRDGVPEYHYSLQKSAERLRRQAKDLEPPVWSGMSSSDQKLNEIAKDCKSIADELTAALESQSHKEVEARRKHEEQHKCSDRLDCKWKLSSLQTVRQVFRVMWQKKDIEALSCRLDLHRRMLDSHVLVDIRADLKNNGGLLAHIRSLNQVHAEALRKGLNGKDHYVVKSMEERLGLINEALQKGQSELLNTVNTFHDQVRSGELFASLPRTLVSLDPRLDTDISKEKAEAEDVVLQSLEFRTMRIRELQVEEAHTSSFHWIFEQQENGGLSFDSLADFLDEGSGIYWVCGQAGSGKSTLMKFVTAHPEVYELLCNWAGSDTLITASHFFWRAGTELQKNHTGLLRFLLHSILSKRRDLVQIAFPGLYKESLLRTDKIGSRDLSTARMNGALRNHSQISS